MNKKIALIALFAMYNSISSEISPSIGVGAVVRKNNPLLININHKKMSALIHGKPRAINDFAGRIYLNAFFNNMFGFRISSDIGNEKKSPPQDDKIDFVKSNFKINLAPIVQYNLNDKVTINSSLGGSYKLVKVTDGELLKKTKHFFGIGSHIGLNYHVNSKIALFAEIGADYYFNKKIKGENNMDLKLKFVDFSGSLGIAFKPK